jgi:hypothetical protein
MKDKCCICGLEGECCGLVFSATDKPICQKCTQLSAYNFLFRCRVCGFYQFAPRTEETINALCAAGLLDKSDLNAPVIIFFADNACMSCNPEAPVEGETVVGYFAHELRG